MFCAWKITLLLILDYQTTIVFGFKRTLKWTKYPESEEGARVYSADCNFPVSSISVCAYKCLEMVPVCHTFGYQRISKSCLLYKTDLTSKNYWSGPTTPYTVYYLSTQFCPSNYHYLVKYQICLEVMNYGYIKIDNYATAKSKCEDNERGHLLYFDEDDMKIDIYQFVKNQGKSLDQFYVGGDSRNNSRSGKYKWLDGRDVGNKTWGTDQPAILKDCLTIKIEDGAYYLTTVWCYEKYHYICEKDL